MPGYSVPPRARELLGKRRDFLSVEFPADAWIQYSRRNFDALVGKIFELDYELTDGKESEIRHVLTEAVCNSAGACGNSPGKKVCVGAHYGNGVLFEVKDDGPGFDYRKYVARARKSPASREDLLKTRLPEGNGIRSIITFTDWFGYADKGKRLYFFFKLEE